MIPPPVLPYEPVHGRSVINITPASTGPAGALAGTAAAAPQSRDHAIYSCRFVFEYEFPLQCRLPASVALTAISNALFMFRIQNKNRLFVYREQDTNAVYFLSFEPGAAVPPRAETPDDASRMHNVTRTNDDDDDDDDDDGDGDLLGPSRTGSRNDPHGAGAAPSSQAKPSQVDPALLTTASAPARERSNTGRSDVSILTSSPARDRSNTGRSEAADSIIPRSVVLQVFGVRVNPLA